MRKMYLASLLVCMSMFALSPVAYAETDPGYKIGDRVEADPTSMPPDSPVKHWSKATVIDVVGNGYVVLLDGPYPRAASVIGYSLNYSRRIPGHVAVPANCPTGGVTSAAVEAEANCWDADARRQAHTTTAQQTQPGPRTPASQVKTQGKSVAELEAEAKAYEDEAARLLAQAHPGAAKPAAQAANKPVQRTITVAPAAPRPVNVAHAPPPAPAKNAAGGAGPRTGDYTCYADNAGNFRLQILGPSRYATLYTGQAPKSGTFSMNGSRLTFVNGPLAGFYGGLLDGGRIGVTSLPQSTYYGTSCDRKQP